MADNEQGQEKTEEATPKKREDSRKQGQVPRSREFNTFFMMLASSVGMIFMGGDLITGLLSVLSESFQPTRTQIFEPKFMVESFFDSVIVALKFLAPLFILLVFVAIASSLSIGGWNFSMKAIQPKASKLNPGKGLKRIFGPKGLVELSKALAKFFIITIIAVLLLQGYADTLLLVGRQAVEPAVATIGNELVWFFFLLSLSLLIIAAADAPFQLWDSAKQIRMSKHEVKQEHKNQEGSPETRARVRQAQRELAMKRMMAEVPEADVIITNPTHYAVAVKYNQNDDGAPVVVAKGVDLVAARIRLVANEHKVPILSSPALARAIFYSTEIDEEIPAGLYMAVAKILAFIFQLRDKPGTDFSSPLTYEDDVPIPDDLRRDE